MKPDKGHNVKTDLFGNEVKDIDFGSSLDVHFSSTTDEWSTPQNVFDSLNREFNFTLDPCCTIQTAKCDRFYTEDDNGLLQDWDKESAFVNPPYSEISTWVRKCYNEYEKGSDVVMLIPSRTDTRWWHRYVMKATEIRFIKGRLKFGGSKNNAPFPSAIVIFKHS